MTDTRAVSDQPIILVAIGGDAHVPVRLPMLPAGSVVVAADSGLDRLAAAGVAAHHVVGDLDSVHPDVLATARAGGATVAEHAADKDATDIELALLVVARELAPATGIDRLVVVGGGGGRLDHLFADLLVLTSPLLAGLEVTAHLGPATISVVRPGVVRQITGGAGDQVSLLPVHGPASGVTTHGLRWALVDADLAAGTTRAISNELTAPAASVTLRDGVVAVVQPGTAAAPVAPRTTAYDPTPRLPGDLR